MAQASEAEKGAFQICSSVLAQCSRHHVTSALVSSVKDPDATYAEVVPFMLRQERIERFTVMGPKLRELQSRRPTSENNQDPAKE